MKNNAQTYFSTILGQFRRQRARNAFLHLGLEFLAINSIYLLFCLILESLWYLSPNTKTVLWLLLSLNGFFLYRGIEIILSRVLNKKKSENELLLLQIGREYGEINDKLLNHYQLSFQNNAIAEQSIEKLITSYPPEHFDNAFKAKPVRTKLYVALVSFLVLFSAIVFIRDPFVRFSHNKMVYEPESKWYITAMPQDTSIYENDSLSIDIRKLASERFPLEIYKRSGTNMEMIFRSMDSVITYSSGKIFSSETYYIKLRRPNIFYPRQFLDIDTVTVTVLNRPKIESMIISVSSPEYSGIPDAIYQGNMDRLKVLYGSELTFSLNLSERAGPSFALWGSDTLEMSINEQTASLSIIPENQGRIILMLSNEMGTSCLHEPSYYIDLEMDNYPELYLLEPKIADKHILSEDMILPYVARLQDDYGFSSFSVHYRSVSEYGFSEDSSFRQIQLPFEKDSRLQTRLGVWDIKEFISPGSEIRYFFELADNDSVSGPKTVRSSMYYAALPTLGDLFESQNQSQEEAMSMLEEELVSTEEIVEEIEDIRKQLLTEGEMNWEDKAALEENLESLENAREELKKMQSTLDEQTQFMEEHKLFSDQVMQSFEQLQDLMNELIDDEMFDMMQDLKDKLERNDTSNMEELLEDFSEKAKRFEESLDRMLEVFKRIQQEQRLEELGKKIKEALKEQQDLLEESGDLPSDDLAKEQKKIADDMEKWEEQSKTSSELFEADDRELFDAFLEKMEEAQLSSAMNAASEQYQQNNKQAGQEMSRSAEDKMKALEKAFSDMASQMMDQQKNEILNAFEKAFKQSLFLSIEHEKTLKSGSELQNNSPLIHQYSSQMQNHLDLAMDINQGLLDLSKQTFLVDKGLGMALGQLIGNLRSGIQHVEEANLSQGKTNFKLAFEHMNTLARMLLERMNMVMDQQQGNASGLEFYMQQLQQMAGQQQQLNSGMPQLGPNGSPGSSMMDQLAKMAARQQALRRGLKQIQQGLAESGEGNKISGNLDRIAKDMEDVINQMRRNRVDRQTIMRQEKIVQRLLDASRSATSRDFKKERESKTGEEILRENPLSLPADLGDPESIIDMIRREVQNSQLSPQEKREMERYLESLIGGQFNAEKK